MKKKSRPWVVPTHLDTKPVGTKPQSDISMIRGLRIKGGANSDSLQRHLQRVTWEAFGEHFGVGERITRL